MTQSPPIRYDFGFLCPPFSIINLKFGQLPCSSPKQFGRNFHPSRFDFRTVETLAASTAAAPAAQADNAAAMTTAVEPETTVAVSEEPMSQAVVHHTAEVKAAEAPVASSETPAATEVPAR